MNSVPPSSPSQSRGPSPLRRAATPGRAVGESKALWSHKGKGFAAALGCSVVVFIMQFRVSGLKLAYAVQRFKKLKALGLSLFRRILWEASRPLKRLCMHTHQLTYSPEHMFGALSQGAKNLLHISTLCGRITNPKIELHASFRVNLQSDHCLFAV